MKIICKALCRLLLHKYEHCAHSERPCKIWCLSTEGSHLTREVEKRTGWTLLTLALQNPPPEFPVCSALHAPSRERVHSASQSKGTPPLGKVSDVADAVHFNTNKGGTINAKEGVSILLRDFREAFPPGNGDGQELWFKQLLGVN